MTRRGTASTGVSGTSSCCDMRRADGSTCRPIELTATKNGQTTTETTTFCKAAGSNDLKPVSV